MLTLEEHIAEIRKATEKYPNAPQTGAIKNLLNDYTPVKPLANLHQAIRDNMNPPLPHQSWFAKLRKQRQHPEQALLNATLETLLSQPIQEDDKSKSSRRSSQSTNSLRSIQTVQDDVVIYNVGQFKQELFLAYYSYFENEGHNLENNLKTALKNALIELMTIYSEYHEAHAKEANAVNKHFHFLRLSVLMEWTTEEGFKKLVGAIQNTEKVLSDASFSLYLTPDKTHHFAFQHLLNWLGILTKHFHGEESLYAMSLIVKILELTQKPIAQTEEEPDSQPRMRQYLNLLQDFDHFFLQPGQSAGQINIDAINSDTFQENIFTLKKDYEDNDPDKYNQSLFTIRRTLVSIYNEVYGLISLNIKNNILGIRNKIYVESTANDATFKELLTSTKIERKSRKNSQRLSTKNSNRSNSPAEGKNNGVMSFRPHRERSESVDDGSGIIRKSQSDNVLSSSSNASSSLTDSKLAGSSESSRAASKQLLEKGKRTLSTT